MSFPEDQLSYLGATIKDFQSQLGYGDQPSSLSITLVEDPKLNQRFIPPSVGGPTYFDYNGWTFGGLFQSWTRTRGSGGFYFNIVINDPRSILEGTQCIFYGYSGITFNVPNVYNVYGYLETNLGFGGSGASEEDGINARLAITTLQSLINTTPIRFKDNYFKVDLSNIYNVCSADYRINADQINLLSLIHSIADDSISDFFIRLEYRGTENFIVPYLVSRANAPVFDAIGNFVNTAEVTYGTVSNTVGRELVNEPTSKLIVGGKVNKIYFTDQTLHSRYVTGKKDDGSYYDTIYDMAIEENIVEKSDMYGWIFGDPNNKYFDWRDKIRRYAQSKAEEASIWPYWGHDARGNLVIGYGLPNSSYTANNVIKNRELGFNHVMIIDGREIARIMMPHYNGRSMPFLEDYMTDTAELAFALEGFDEWIRYIILSSLTPLHHNRLYSVSEGNFQLLNPDFTYANQGYYTKVDCLGLSQLCDIGNKIKELDTAVVKWIKGETRKLNTNLFSLTSQFFTNRSSILSESFLRDAQPDNQIVALLNDIQQVYNFIRQFAIDHLGKKYMVTIPNIQAARNNNTGDIVYSVMPSSGGFFEEEEWGTAISRALMPADVNKVLTEDARIRTYVRFNNQLVTRNNFTFGKLNPSLFSPQDLATNVNNLNPNNPYDEFFFVLAETLPEPVFLDNATLDSPRIVVSLPEKMVLRLPKGYKPMQAFFYKMLLYYKFVYTGDTTTFMNVNGQLIDINSVIVSAVKDNLAGTVGNDGFANSTVEAPCVMPDMAFIALESNVERYGPWYAIGINGATDMEQDNDLVPWKYGGFTEMNAVARARLAQAASNRLEVERGTVEFPGAPTYLLGDAMVANGPVITSINVGIDPQAGVTTTYSMQTWTPQFGNLPKNMADKISTISNLNLKNQRLLNDMSRMRATNMSNIKFTGGTAKESTRASRKNSTHSSMVVLGAAHRRKESETHAVAAAMPAYYIENQATDGYEDKAFMSMEGMFRPYCTETQVGVSGMSHFETPTSNAEHPTVNDLNPFGGNHDISLVSRNLNLETTDVENPFENPYLRNANQEPSPTSIKGVSLRGPLVVTGWGYDTNGKPVPSGGDGVSFISNHRCREDLWKTGPVDLRWDNDRKVWGLKVNKIYKGVLAEDIIINGSGNAYLLTKDGMIGATKYVKYIDSKTSTSLNSICRNTDIIFADVENFDTPIIINAEEYRKCDISINSANVYGTTSDEIILELQNSSELNSQKVQWYNQYTGICCSGYYRFNIKPNINWYDTRTGTTLDTHLSQQFFELDFNLESYNQNTSSWDVIDSQNVEIYFMNYLNPSPAPFTNTVIRLSDKTDIQGIDIIKDIYPDRDKQFRIRIVPNPGVENVSTAALTISFDNAYIEKVNNYRAV